MKEKIEFYILFEEAEDGYYGDILVNHTLYNKAEVDAYIQANAMEIYPYKGDSEKSGIDCYFKALSKDVYGTGTFYFRKFSRTNHLEENSTNVSAE